MRVFKRVRAQVARKTEQQQIPWKSSSLVGDFVFNPSTKANSKPSGKTDRATDAAVKLMFWQSVLNNKNPAVYEEYLREFPERRFTGLERPHEHNAAEK